MSVSLLPVLAAATADSRLPGFSSCPSPAWAGGVVPPPASPDAAAEDAEEQAGSALKKGDQVLTGGGFIGKVVKVDDDYVDVELAPGLKVKALKSTIGDVIPPAGSAAND
jgi:preprotein translocase subunit YajC